MFFVTKFKKIWNEQKGNMYVHWIFLYRTHPRTFIRLIFLLLIQSRKINYCVDIKQQCLVFNDKSLKFIRCMNLLLIKFDLTVLLELKAASTQQSLWAFQKPITVIWYFGQYFEDFSTQLKDQTKAWLKWWSFQCVALSDCMQSNTHH